jgi:outer membrane scaffolding protein for murein synthesis (MipA/OmpV family)
MARLSGHWTAVGMVTADYLDAAWTDSPLIEDTWTLRSVLTVARSF